MLEQPAYSEINDLEMRDLEAEFGRPLTRQMAFWLIRHRINRGAVQRMLNVSDDEEQPPAPNRRAA